MSLQLSSIIPSARAGFEGLAIVDTDVHPFPGDKLLPYISERWRRQLALTGARRRASGGVFSPARPFNSRLDALPLGGGPPGGDPEFARDQLLDEYGISAAILNIIVGPIDTMNAPVEQEVDVARAMNDYLYEAWLSSDPRWLGSIHVPFNHPERAVAEIVRARELSDRFVQILGPTRSERPQGNPKYWPIYEAAAEYGLPVAFHISTHGMFHPQTGAGITTYYYEQKTTTTMQAQSMVTSFVFEGVFDRWPTLQIVPTEVRWDWAIPMSWRLDSSWRVLRDEVPHLQRRPSEYLSNFWFTTQPSVETEKPAQIYELLEQFERVVGDRLTFATDYPHWDMDSPFEALPRRLPIEAKRKLLADNAAALYGLELVATE